MKIFFFTIQVASLGLGIIFIVSGLTVPSDTARRLRKFVYEAWGSVNIAGEEVSTALRDVARRLAVHVSNSLDKLRGQGFLGLADGVCAVALFQGLSGVAIVGLMEIFQASDWDEYGAWVGYVQLLVLVLMLVGLASELVKLVHRLRRRLARPALVAYVGIATTFCVYASFRSSYEMRILLLLGAVVGVAFGLVGLQATRVAFARAQSSLLGFTLLAIGPGAVILLARGLKASTDALLVGYEMPNEPFENLVSSLVIWSLISAVLTTTLIAVFPLLFLGLFFVILIYKPFAGGLQVLNEAPPKRSGVLAVGVALVAFGATGAEAIGAKFQNLPWWGL